MVPTKDVNEHPALEGRMRSLEYGCHPSQVSNLLPATSTSVFRLEDIYGSKYMHFKPSNTYMEGVDTSAEWDIGDPRISRYDNRRKIWNHPKAGQLPQAHHRNRCLNIRVLSTLG